jgi:hypothetical protein
MCSSHHRDAPNRRSLTFRASGTAAGTPAEDSAALGHTAAVCPSSGLFGFLKARRNAKQPTKEGHMTADALKKITTDALDKLAALLNEGHSDQLTALLKTMARFHKYSFLC